MRIEDFWSDIDIYHVSFEVKTGIGEMAKVKKINKTVVFPAGTTEEEVITLVMNRFSKVKNIQSIDYCEEALLLKV